MNKYVVTYRTLALSNSEIEVDPKKADEIRAELARKTKDHEPAALGRDWDWTESVRNVVIEADYYSISNEGSAHFYRVYHKQEDLPHGSAAPKPALIASITQPVTIALKDDKGTGGIGKMNWDYTPEKDAWFKNKGFPPGTFSINDMREKEGLDISGKSEACLRQDITRALRERESLVYGKDWYFTPVTVPAHEATKVPEPERHALPLSLDELTALRAALPNRSGTNADLDAKLYAAQIILSTRKHKSPPKTETPVFNKICIGVRYRSKDGSVRQRYFDIDKAYFLDLVHLDEVDGV